MYLLYSLFAAFALLLLSPYFLLRDLTGHKRLRNLRQRMAFFPPDAVKRAVSPVPDGGSIWIHAVSVGEVIAAVPLARRLHDEFPQRSLFISTTTDTGHAIARERIPWASAFFYFPLDFAWIVRRFLRVLHPAVIIIMETEIWPNFLRQSRRAGVPVIFANARISNRSFRNYRLINRFFNQFISSSLNNAAAFLAQSAEDANRLAQLGANESRIEVAGNLKYDLSEPPAGPFLHWLRDQVRTQERWPVVVAGSVAADEEESVLAAFDVVQRQWRRALLVLAPRKPDRFERAAEIVIQDGWLVSRRSNISWDAPLKEDADVLLLDSMGELGAVYGLADAVFVGGSLVPAGGHNLLEPALYARPPVFGPHMQNFQEMAAQFLSARAGLQVRNAQELGLTWAKVIGSDAMTRQMGQAALALVLRHRGATERTLARISEVLSREFGNGWRRNAAARGQKSSS